MAIKATTLITLTRVNDGKGIKSTSVTYQIWSNGTSTPTGTWSSTPPKTTADKPYLWTRTVITYSDSTQSTSYSVGSTPEGIQVGGRNLLRNSSSFTDWNNSGGWKITKDDSHSTISCSTSNSTSLNLYSMYSKKVNMNLLLNQNFTLSFDLKVDDWSKWDIPSPVILEYYNANNARIYYHDTYLSDSFVKIKGDKKNGEWVKVVLTKKGDLSNMNICVDNVTLNDVKFFGVRFALFKNGSIHIRKPKLEIGTISTDWTPAPEDVDEAINTERTERQSAIETKANEITSKVSETYVSNSAFEHYQNTVSTQFTQTKKDFTWSINQSVTDAKNEMSGQIDSVNGRLDGLKQTTDNVNSYMSFDNDALTLGKSDSAFKTKITNQEWSIQKNGAKVTYINDQTMYITDGQFTQSLKVGAFGFVPRANGSLDFKKVG